LLGLNLEEVTARLGRLLRPAANRKEAAAVANALMDLSLEPSLGLGGGGGGEDQNLDDFEMIAMTAVEEPKSRPTALDSSFR
jgi:hypothetical protein